MEETEDVKWTCVVFCRDCKELINKARHVSDGMKPLLDKFAPLDSFCNESEHNDFDDCNFNIKVVWLREWPYDDEKGEPSSEEKA